MLTTSEETQEVWAAGVYVGPTRPVVRATVQKLAVCFRDYNLSGVDYLDLDGRGLFTSLPWGQPHVPIELPNLKSVKWARSVDQDVATATIELYNTMPVPVGRPSDDPDSFDLPGFFTPMRGHGMASPWSFYPDAWTDLLRPDRLVRTYQGYGVDWDLPPETDPHLYPSGVWLIDDVVLGTDGVLTLECRDIGRVLLDQICMPPVVPADQYPLYWDRVHDVADLPGPDLGDSGWFRPDYDLDSNGHWVGEGIMDGEDPLVEPDGSIAGHSGADAFDGSTDTYWLSVGTPDDPTGMGGTLGSLARWSVRQSAYVYVQGVFAAQTIRAVHVRVFGGPYVMYVSVFAGGSWQGRSRIPYDPFRVDTHADIRFVKQVDVARGGHRVVKFKNPIEGATKVRITLGDLWNSQLGEDYTYRGAIRAVEVNGNELEDVDTGLTHVEGNYEDYTDIVKWFLAWSGFYWFRDTNLAFQTRSDGVRVYYPPYENDPTFPPDRGQVWGDFEQTGTGNYVDPESNYSAGLGIEIWDKKPIMDCILGGTLVKTSDGWRPIEAIRIGDEVANAIGYGRVIGRRSLRRSRLVRLVVAGEELVCTPGHRLLTDRGWVSAREVRQGERIVTHLGARASKLRLVRDAVLGEPDADGASQDVFGPVSTSAGRPQQDDVRAAALPGVRLLFHGPGESEEGEVLLGRLSPPSQADPGRADVCDLREVLLAKDVCPAGVLDGVSTASCLRAGPGRVVRATVPSLARARAGLAAGVLDQPVGRAAGSGVHDARSGSSDDQDRCRDRRGQPSVLATAVSGSPSRSMADFARVDSVEVLQSGSARWREVCGGDDPATVYDLTVSGHPSFVVGRHELVAHNCILYVREMVGFNFYIDEFGGAIFRSPNIWVQGNYLTPATGPAVQGANGRQTVPRTAQVLEIDENVTLMSITARLSSRSMRDRTIVANTTGTVSGVAKGYEPLAPERTGLRRIGLWTDQGFATSKECRIMAGLISIRQMFTYHTNSVTIPGNPALQIDDQVWIFERVTSEWYLHYVKSIASDWDAATGVWTYTLETFWLGEAPGAEWIWDASMMTSDLREYLVGQGKVPE